MEPAGPEVVASEHCRAFDPALDRFARLVGDLELDGPLGLALQDRGALIHMARYEDVPHLQAHEITTPQLGVDGHVEEGEVADVVRYLEPHADRPDMFWLKRAFLTDNAALVSGRDFCTNDRKLNCGHGFSSLRHTRPTPTLCW
jgi:hypothetical protein